jgi:peptidoglycan/LPS O-acetylase OafA/YrhL
MANLAPQAAPPQRRRIQGLDALRGLAAISVMLYHYTAWYQFAETGQMPSSLLISFPYGNFGVELFFIISGFVIFMTLEQTPTVYDFVTSRFARLYPAFVACLVLTVAIAHALRYAPGNVYGTLLAANLTMAPGLFGFPGIDGSYWSLLYELAFYGLAAVTVVGLGWQRPELPCLVWLLIALVVRSVGVLRLPGLVEMLTVAQFAHLFVIGILLYRIHVGRVTWLTYPLLGFALAMSLFGPHWAFKPLPFPFYTVMTAGFAGLVWLAVADRLPVLHAAPLRFFGRISYPLYLIHQVAGFAVMARLEATGVTPNLAVAVTMALVVALAWAVSAGVEWPARRWLRKVFARQRARLVRPAVP